MTELFELTGKISIVGADQAEMTVQKVIDSVRASGEKINGILSSLGKDVSFADGAMIQMPDINIPGNASSFVPGIDTDIPLEGVVSAIKDKLSGLSRGISDIELPPVFISEKTKDSGSSDAGGENIFKRLSDLIVSISAQKNEPLGRKDDMHGNEISISANAPKDPFEMLSERLPDSAKRTKELISELLSDIFDSGREKTESEGLEKLLGSDAEKASASVAKGLDKAENVLGKALDRISKESKTRWNSIASSADGVGRKMADSVSSGVSGVESACRNAANRAAAALTISGENAGAYLIDTMNSGISARAWELYRTASNIASNISGIMSSVSLSVNAVSGSSRLTGHAKGGIVTREHIARVGEEGAEAIIPLENNTEWIDKVAERLNVSGSDDRVLSKLDELNRNISGMKIYLDGTTLVGSLAPQLDRKLGSIARQKRRAFV